MLFILLAFAWIVSIMLYVVCISIERQRLSYIALTLVFYDFRNSSCVFSFRKNICNEIADEILMTVTSGEKWRENEYSKNEKTT